MTSKFKKLSKKKIKRNPDFLKLLSEELGRKVIVMHNRGYISGRLEALHGNKFYVNTPKNIFGDAYLYFKPSDVKDINFMDGDVKIMLNF